MARTENADSPAPAQDGPRFVQLPPAEQLKGLGLLHFAFLDADAFPDLAAAATPEPGDSSTVRILHGRGDGSFSLAQTIKLPHPGVNCLASGDINGDAAVDLALAAHDSYNVWLLFSSGQSGFSLAPQPVVMHSGSHPHTHSLALCDMNGDQRLDLLTTCADDNAIAVLLQQQAGSFQVAPGSPYAAGQHPYENLLCQDLTRDGHADCVVTNLHGASVSVLVGDGSGALQQGPASPHATGPRPGFAALGDYDGDGEVDIAVSHDDEALLALYYGGGYGGFVPAPGSPFVLPQRVWSLHVADIDADGRNEIVCGCLGSSRQESALLIIPGGKRFGPVLPAPRRIPVSGGQLQYIYLADLNADGRLDVVANFWDNHDSVVLIQE